jgi:ribosomal protein L40E
MINVCTECIKLNPLDRENCHYCNGKCEKIEDFRLKTFLIELNQRKIQKSKKEEDKDEQQ